MPRDSSGNYTLPAGNPVVGGTTITPTWANPTMSDIGTELTNSLDRNGRGGMLAPFKFADGTLGAPGITWNAEPTSGIFRAAGNDMQAVIAGVPRMRWTASSVDVWDTTLVAWLPIVGPSGSTYALVSSPNTFTAVNTFTQPVLFTYAGIGTLNQAAIVLKSIQPNAIFQDTDAPADTKGWRIVAAGGDFLMQLLTDAGVPNSNVYIISRSAAALTNITWGNATDNPTYAFLGTGATTFGGIVRIMASNASMRWRGNAAADKKIWDFVALDAGGTFDGRHLNDAESGSSSWLSVLASGSSAGITSITLGQAGAATTYNFPSLGLASFAGNVSYAGSIRGTAGVTALSGTFELVAPQPGFWWNETDQGADGKIWVDYLSSGALQRTIWNDAGSVAKAWQTVTRAANVVSSIIYGNVTDNPAYGFVGTGTMTVGGRIQAGDGSVAFPEFSFNLDPDTGWYRPSGNVLASAVGGQQGPVMQQNGGVGQFAAQNGLVGFPGITFVNDADSGFFLPGAGGVQAVCGGVNIATFIGPPFSALSRLSIANVLSLPNASSSQPAICFETDLTTGIYRVGASALAICAAATDIAYFRKDLANSSISIVDGTAAVPAVNFFADTNTGIYRIGGDQLGFSEGGVGFRMGFRSVPVSATATTLVAEDVGKCVPITADIAIPVSVFAAGDAVSIYNDSAANKNLTLAAGTLRLAGTTTAGSPRILAPRTLATIWFRSGGATPEVICSGSGVS